MNDTTYCKLCQVPLSGAEPALQHYAGKPHKKKAQEAELRDLLSENSGASPQDDGLFQDSGDENVDSDADDALFSDHSEDEPEKVKLKELVAQLSDVRIVDEPANQRQRGVDPTRYSVMEGGLSSFAKASTTVGLVGVQVPKKEYTLKEGRGRCHICNIELTSAQHSDQHLKGKQHKKVKARWESRKLGAAESADVPNAGVQSKPLPQLAHSFDVNTDSGQCYVCDISLDSFADARQHLRSEEHEEKEQIWKKALAAPQVKVLPHAVNLPTTPGTRWHHCEVCGNCLNTETELLKHRLTPKHLKAVEKQKAIKELGAQCLTPAGDRTLWYQCHICPKKVNSADQLMLHVRSHGVSPDNIPGLSGSSAPSPKNGTPPARRRLDHEGFYRASLEDVSVIGAGEKLNPRNTGTTTTTTTESTGSDHDSVDSKPVEDPPNDLQDSTPVKTVPDTEKKTSVQWQTWEKTADTDPPLNIQKEDLSGNNLSAPPGEHASGSSDRSHGRTSLFSRNGHDHDDEEDQDADGDLAQTFCKQIALDDDVDETTVTCMETSEENMSGARNQDCLTFNCTNHCATCDMHFNGVRPWEDHVKGKTHQAKLGLLSAQRDPDGATGGNPFPLFRYYCDICNRPFNTLDSQQAHLRGKDHRSKVVKAEKVPDDRRLEDIVKIASADDCGDEAYELVEKIPRGYQVELYIKAMDRDTVCFLPTGTGKTMISAMVISHMLQLNPQRPVVFLVDKVLLVLQQAEVLKRELGGKLYDRYDADDVLDNRKLRIASMCGGKQETVGISLWKHDLIVVTADYYLNLLGKSLIRWEDHCLAVFDEAHHCDKSHPFHRILNTYHLALPEKDRPKVLGLTASPAGKETLKKTEAMFYKLLENMGGVALTTVEGGGNVRELKTYQSNTKLEVVNVKLSTQEEVIEALLLNGIHQCFRWLLRETTLLEQPGMREMCLLVEGTGDNPSDPEQDSRELWNDALQNFLNAFSRIKVKRLPMRNQFAVVTAYAKALCYGFVTLNSLGLWFTLRELQPLLPDQEAGNFSGVRQVGIDVSELRKLVEEFDDGTGEDIDSTDEKLLDCMPAIRRLTTEILSVGWDDMGGTKIKPIVLVLVRERKDVLALEKILKRLDVLCDKHLKVVSIVGHGTRGTSEARGMTVQKQNRALVAVKNHEFQIIVATSVAEEGVDLPMCELVIQMDPPSCVKALVQIRGRARKRDSRFVAICRTEGQSRQIEELQRKEAYMVEAANNVIERQKKKMDRFLE